MFDFLDIGKSIKIIMCVDVGKLWELIIYVNAWFLDIGKC